MRAGNLKFHLTPFGAAETVIKELVDLDTPCSAWVRAALRRPSGHKEYFHQIWVASVSDLNKNFIKCFRERSTPATRLLLFDFDEGQSVDFLLAHVLALRIRSPHRMYITNRLGAKPEQKRTALCEYFQRLAASAFSEDNADRIFDAKITNDTLHVISSSFSRLDVSLKAIPSLAGKDPAALQNIEIDEDGAFIYWPQLDVHLGWDQLNQIVNPIAALKARQKHQKFKVRYGKALQDLREIAGLGRGDIPGISEKQLRRIEKGECRLTSNAVEALAKSFQIPPNEFLKRLAERLKHF